jgi:hypothetical protein
VKNVRLYLLTALMALLLSQGASLALADCQAPGGGFANYSTATRLDWQCAAWNGECYVMACNTFTPGSYWACYCHGDGSGNSYPYSDLCYGYFPCNCDL